MSPTTTHDDGPTSPLEARLRDALRTEATGVDASPAVWSAMLAARAEGVGSALTSVLLFKGDEVPKLLGVPQDQGWMMSCCVTMGYPLGKWGVAKRAAVDTVSKPM